MSGKFVAMVVFLCVVACSPAKPARRIEIYYPSTRQEPLEPVYNRTTWSQLPQAFPPADNEKAPYFAQVMYADFPNASLGEAVQAVAQTMGYRADYPASIAGRRISLKFSGTFDEILGAVGRQGKVSVEVDHTSKLVKVMDSGGISPQLEPVSQ
jgi:hypothetical protein